MRLVETRHAREVRGVSQRLLGRHRLLAAPAADVGREDRRQLRGEADRFSVLGLMRVVALAGILDRRSRDDRPQDVHGGTAFGHLAQDLPQEGRERAVLRELGFEVA